MKKRVISLLLVIVMVLGMLPAWEVQAAAAEETFDNSDLSLGAGGTAYCPACKKTVAWTALSGAKAAALWLQDGGHYYLSGELSSSATDGTITVNTTSGNAACLHLNGHNMTSSAFCTITYAQTSPGTLNIMGNGTVSGSGTVAASKWKAATLNVTNGAILNLYGGTYTKGASDAPVVWVWAGQVNLYDGAEIVGTSENVGNYSSAVLLQNAGASFDMHGGTISGGHNQNSGGNVNINNGSFTMQAGTISGGTAVGYYGGNVYLKAGSFTMTGGTIEGGSATYHGSNVYVNTSGVTAQISGGTVTDGNVYVAGAGTTTLSGAPVIEELKLPANVTVAAGGLTAGADVAVNATGVFTTGTANLGSFRASNGTDSIMAGADGALRYVSNAKLSFESGTTNAYCPVCAKTVSWTAVSTSLSSTLWTKDTNHYYLTGNVTYAGTDQAIYSPTGGVAKTACLHLNGFDLTATAGRAIHCGDGTLNIMGNGTVSGNQSASYGGATFNTWGNGKLNLYGGTYTKGASQYPVLYVGAYTVNLYSGATIEGSGTTPSGYALVLAENANSVMNMYGGTVQNGTSTGGCGGVRFYNGTFNMQGGTIRNCTGTIGGNIHVYNAGKANISGGKIENGSVYAAVTDTLTLSGAPKIGALVLAADVAVKVNALTAGAEISISSECTVTTTDDLQAYVDAGYFVTPLENKMVAVESGKLVICDIPEEEPEAPENTGPVYIKGGVLYETDFESDTVGQLPAGWSAGYSEGTGANKTNFGWGSGGKMTAQVEAFGDFGKVFHFTSGNNDAFAAMGEIPTTNYLYEAQVYVDYGYGSFGLANNYYAPTTTATGALFSSIYPKGDAAKYTYKGAGLSGSNLWTTSYSPVSGDIVTLQILSLNGQNYIMYNGQIVAQCAARLQGQTVDHPGFYTCYGGIYVLGVKVTEVFAADVQLDAARVSVSQDSTATVQLELGFAKDQGLYTNYAGSDGSKLQFGVVLAVGAEDASASLTQDTQDAMVINFKDSDKTESDEKIVCTTALILDQSNYEVRYSVRPFVEIDGICFYGDGAAYMPAELANGAYLSATETGKQRIAGVFGSCENFTADGNKEVTFTLFSDFHYIAGMYPATISDLKTILKRADDSNSSFVLSAGDFTNDMKGSPELYNTYRNYVTQEGKVLPAYNVYGNHELEYGNSMETVTWTLTNDEYTDHTVVWGTADGSFDDYIGYYYFESDGFRVIGLDSEHSFNPTTQQWEHNRPGSSGAPSGNTKVGSLGPVQLAWLEDVLMDAAEKDIPCIVVAHDGFTGLNWGNTSPDSEAVRALYAKANKANPGTVLMSINGHIHTDHQGWNDGVFYLDTNTVRNNWWQDTAVDHYTDEHTFMFEEYDEAGNLIATYEKPYNTLTMGAKTWFSEDPISCTVTLSEAGIVDVEGVKSDWACGIVPTAATTVSGVECEITSGMYWNCDQYGHIEQQVITEAEHHIVCTNTQCGYESIPQSHSGMLLQLSDGTVSFPADSSSAVQENMANDGSYIKLLKNDTVFNLAADQTACIDVNGKKTTISGSGTLQGADSANDAYKTSVGAATVADTVTIAPDAAVNGNRYIAIADNGRATFHRLNMRLTTVSLRTASCGIYYKAKYECDDTLAAKVDSYGVVFSVKNMPGADFKTELADNNRYTTLTPDASFGDGTVATSGSIFNIMKTAYDAGGDVAQSNAARGEMPIYANAYVVVSGKTFVADTANANKKVTDEGFNKGVAYSMLDVLKLIDANWSKYVASGQDETVKAFYGAWKNKGMSAWADALTNIDA